MDFEQAWLSYRMMGEDSEWRGLGRIYADTGNTIVKNVVNEIQRAFREMAGEASVLCVNSLEGDSQTGNIIFRQDGTCKKEGYHLYEENGNAVIAASSECGWFYGDFELIRQMQMEKPFRGMDIRKEPEMPLRMLNHWDNMDGSIERGYSGNSLVFTLIWRRQRILLRILCQGRHLDRQDAAWRRLPIREMMRTGQAMIWRPLIFMDSAG